MKTKETNIRLSVQIFFFLVIGLIAINHTLAESGMSIPFFASASIHAICPFGGVETFYQLVTTGGYIQKIHSSALVLMGIAFTLALLFGPVLCGWICPLGSLQEWIGKIGKRLLGQRYNHLVPRKIDHVLRYLRYVVLGLVMYNTAKSGMLLFANVDPYYALFHFWTGDTAVAALVVLGITMVSALFVERAWCKYACPYGALLGLFNPIRVFKIRRDANLCIDCGNCDRHCPMNIEVSSKGNVTNHQCISCLKCTSQNSCPIENTVQLLPMMTVPKSVNKNIGAVPLAIIIVVLMFGGIGATSALGYYSTESDKQPSRIESGEASGNYDPSDIRGSYTFSEVSTLFEIDPDILLKAFDLPSDTDLSSFQSKSLEPLYEELGVSIGNGSLQVFVALYNNLPIVLGDDLLPKSAVDLIYANNTQLTEAQLDYLKTHTFEKSEVGKSETTQPAAAETESEPAVNGQTTFQGLLDLGIPQAEIEKILKAPMPATNLTVRSYCQENGLSFSEVKAAFNALVD